MKYIMLQHRNGAFDTPLPIIFPDIFVHKDMAQIMTHQLIKQGPGEITVLSAGFIDPASCRCFGESTSLKVKSMPSDEITIRSYNFVTGL